MSHYGLEYIYLESGGSSVQFCVVDTRPTTQVWCPQTSYQTFVLVNDDGKTLRRGRPRGAIPSLQQRVRNYDVVRGSKYARGCVPAPEEAAWGVDQNF